MVASAVPPHFQTGAWAISTANLTNIQPFPALRIFVAAYLFSLGFSSLIVCAMHVIVAPCEHTMLTTQYVESVCIRYSTEHKEYHCYCHVGLQMSVS